MGYGHIDFYNRWLLLARAAAVPSRYRPSWLPGAVPSSHWRAVAQDVRHTSVGRRLLHDNERARLRAEGSSQNWSVRCNWHRTRRATAPAEHDCASQLRGEL